MNVHDIETRSIRFLGLSAAAALLVVACGGSGSGSPSAITPTTGPSTAATAAPSTATGAFTIATGTTASAGTVLTGKDGLTVYTFKKDTTPNASACTGDCATNWPAVTVAAGQTPTAGSGVTGTLATFTRSDGPSQVSYNGAPLYYYAGDSAAGDANGQGKGNVWYAATPSGATGSPAPSTGASPAPSTAGNVHTVDLATGGGSSYLTGDNGLALYVFKKDGQSTSACTSSNCTTNWPPFTIKQGETAGAGSGVTGNIATFARPDGAMQVTFNGAPLYYFAGDTKAGDTNGTDVSPDWSLAAQKARPGY